MNKKYFSHLTVEEKHILVEKGTEPPFTGKYNNFFEAGVFLCRACKTPLYESNTKFNSGCGWPSFDDEIDGAITRHEDLSEGRIRTEICCSKCKGHLGHVFKGEKITKKNTRHCVNSLSIQFKPYKSLEKATFGAGCFWYVQSVFKKVQGVYMCAVGYMGGEIPNPTYEEVCLGATGHIEVVHIYFDQKIVSYFELLTGFWNNHNPTMLNRQGSNIGSQYKSTIFYHSHKQKEVAKTSLFKQSKKWETPIVTELVAASTFYRAEECHQDYLNKNKLGSCKV